MSNVQASSMPMGSAMAAPCKWNVIVPLVLFAMFAVMPIFAAYGAESYLLGVVMRVMTFSIAAIALNLLVGFGALPSFGHAAFVGIGAYAVGILSSHGINDAAISLPVALAGAALFALLSGLVCLRTKGPYFIMITLAFGQMMFFTATSLAPYGGDDGLTIPSRNTVAGFGLLESDRSLYYFVFALLVLTYLLCRCLVNSRFGRVLRGAKENSMRVSTLGFQVYLFQLTAYVISGTIAGLAGFLLANATNFVSPAYMSWTRSGELLIMIILGGTGSITGAVVGSGAFILLEEWLAGYTEHWKMIFGPLLVLVALFLPGGLSGIGAMILRRLRRD